MKLLASLFLEPEDVPEVKADTFGLSRWACSIRLGPNTYAHMNDAQAQALADSLARAGVCARVGEPGTVNEKGVELEKEPEPELGIENEKGPELAPDGGSCGCAYIGGGVTLQSGCALHAAEGTR